MSFFFILSIMWCSLYADFIHEILKENEKKLTWSFNFKFRYIDDVLSLNTFYDFVNCIYVIELEIKDTTDTAKTTSYFVLHLDIDSEGPLRAHFYDKRDDFNISIVGFLFIYLNMLQHYNNTSMWNTYFSVDIPESVFPIMIYLIEGYYWRWSSYWINCF